MKVYTVKKRLFYSMILLVFSFIVVEAGAHLFYTALKRQPFPFRLYNDAILRIAAPSESAGVEDQLTGVGRLVWQDYAVDVIHPYLGFVHDPKRTPNTSYLGFPEKNDDPLGRRNSGSVTVAVLGGSFAEGTSIIGESVMEKTLQDHGIDARILTAAMGGYKQPQQLFTLAYLLSHDAQIDVVINIDGFNEVVLPQAENLPMGVNPFYPRAWYFRLLNINDPVTLRMIGQVSALEDDRRRWAMLFRDILKFSIIRNLIWRAYDKFLEGQIADFNDQIRRLQRRKTSSFLTTGPNIELDEKTELYQQIANHWKSCSLLMKALCDSRGIAYIHILQPNQYFEAGRTLTEAEKREAFDEEHPYRQGVVKGYPKLLAAKKDLIDRGVNFHDLTMVYHDIPQRIYDDDCCHPNTFGYKIIAKYVAHTILKAMNLQSAEQSAAADAPTSRR